MWEPILLPLLFNGVGLGIALLRRGRRLRAWRDAAAACGLKSVQTFGIHPELAARAGPWDVGIDTCGSKRRHTQITVQVPWPPHFRDVRIRSELRFRSGPEIEICDQPFDSKFFIEGPALQVLALLDAETRRLMSSVNSESLLEVSAGTLRAEGKIDEIIPDLLPLLVDIGWRITGQAAIPRRLADNVKDDPEPGVRLQNLLCLIRELPEAPETREALRTACSDPSPQVRLQAAKGLGAEGRGVLLDLAESLVDDTVSAEAVSILDRELPLERMTAILDCALACRLPRTVRACLEALGKRGDAAAVDEIGKVLAVERGELAAAAARALGATGSPAAEPPLIRALQREQTVLRVAAAEALGRVGSVAAVLSLQEAIKAFWLDLELHRAARQAIAEIQSRLQGASPGQLSLAEAGAGQLSLASSEAGQLSLATDPAGHLSLGPEEAKPFARRAREAPVVRRG